MVAVGMQLPQPRWLYLLVYNVGRISSYVFAGALAGWLGASGLLFDFLFPIQKLFYLLSNLMLLLLGLYLGNIWHGLLFFEKIGGRFWRKIEPLGRRLFPIKNLRVAYVAGLLWGWLPCGLVYSVLVAALASAKPMHGAAIMLMFGLGTLPMLLSVGAASHQLKPYLQNEKLRLICGGMVAMFGAVGLYRLLMLA